MNRIAFCMSLVALTGCGASGGVPRSDVQARHAERAHPARHRLALNVGGLIGGAVIIESIFQLDGMGPYFITNLLNQDTYAVMAWLMVAATWVILLNLVADIAYAYIDPRIRHD